MLCFEPGFDNGGRLRVAKNDQRRQYVQARRRKYRLEATKIRSQRQTATLLQRSGEKKPENIGTPFRDRFLAQKSTPSGTIDLKKIVSVSDMEEDCTFHIVYPGRTYKLRGRKSEAVTHAYPV